MPHVSPDKSGCDYVDETARVLAKLNTVFTISLHEPYTWKGVLKRHRKEKAGHSGNKRPYISLRPFFLIPGSRFQPIYLLNLRIFFVVFNTYMFIRFTRQKKLLWFFEPLYASSILPLFRTWRSIYDDNDYFGSLGVQWKHDEQYLLKHADQVFTNSEKLKSRMCIIRPVINVIPPGFASDVFRNRSVIKTKGNHLVHVRRVIGYVGSIDFRLDYMLLFSLVHMFPTTPFIFVGPVGPNEGGKNVTALAHKLFSYPNVIHIDEVTKKHIPSYIQLFDICMIPFDVTQPFVRFGTPMKFFEYLYEKKPVISTDIESLHMYRNYFFTENTASGWKRTIRLIQRTKNIDKRYMYSEHLIEELSWERRIERIEKYL